MAYLSGADSDVGQRGCYKSKGAQPMVSTGLVYSNMFAKIFLGCLLVVAAASPLPQEDDDIPVYTEKVVPNRPTAAPKASQTVPKAPRFSSQKLRYVPKALPKKNLLSVVESKGPYEEEKVEPLVPKVVRKLVKTSRHTRRSRPSFKPAKVALRGEYAAPEPTYRVPQRQYDGGRELSYPAPEPAYLVPRSNYAADRETEYVARAAEHRDVPYEKPQPYSFGYDIKDKYGATQSRKEEGDDYGNKRGSYGYTDGYGIYRQVDYIADKHGFRASVKTNEPGTENQDPADVEIHSETASPKY